MNREAELIYMRDIRDLELAKDRLNSEIYFSKKEIEKKYQELEGLHYIPINDNRTDYLLTTVFNIISMALLFFMGEKWYESGVILLAFPLIIVVLIINYWIFEDDPIERVFAVLLALTSAVYTYYFYGTSKYFKLFNGLFSKYEEGEPAGLPVIWLIIGAIIGFVLFFVIPCLKEKKRNNIIEDKNDSIQQERAKRKASANRVEERNTKEINYLKQELNSIERLLKNGYSVNLIPTQYRGNLTAIWYIYDWMNSTGASLRDALFSAKLEEGIQRLESRMQTVINQNEEIIFNQRMSEGRQRKMVHYLESIQDNSYETAKYAQIAANYSEVSAFFSVANYLKR